MENISVVGMATYAGMIMVQLISALYAVVSKIILIQGISSTVFVTYQLAMATLVAASVAFIFQRGNWPPFSISIVCWIFVLALVGIVGSMILIGYIYLLSKKMEEMHRLMERENDTCASLIENIAQ